MANFLGNKALQRVLIAIAVTASGWAWYKHVLQSNTGSNTTSEELAFTSRERPTRALPPNASDKSNSAGGLDNSSSQAPKDSSSVDPLMAEAQALIDKGAIAEGVAILEDIVRREPNNTQAMMELAMVYTLDYKAPVKARQLLEKVIDVNPNHRAALNELELLYNELGAQADGMAWLHLKAEQFPEALEVQFAYGRMLANTDPAGAIPWLIKATQIADDREHAFNELATAALKAGKLSMAIESWTKALQLAEADLEKAKASGDTGIDLLEDRITVTKSSISNAQKQISIQ